MAQRLQATLPSERRSAPIPSKALEDGMLVVKAGTPCVRQVSTQRPQDHLGREAPTLEHAALPRRHLARLS